MREGGLGNQSGVYFSNHVEWGVTHGHREDSWRNRFLGGKQELSCDHIKFEMFQKHPRGAVKHVIWINEKGARRGDPT